MELHKKLSLLAKNHFLHSMIISIVIKNKKIKIKGAKTLKF